MLQFSSNRGHLSALLAVGVVLLFCLPIVLGLVGTVIPAFGLMPALSEGNGFVQLVNDPRFAPSLWLTLKTGVAASLLVLLVTIVALVCLHQTRWWRWLLTAMPPLLAIPHAAMAVGLVFLFAPSGWIVRLFSPWLTGWERPPSDWVVPDAGGWSLVAGLVMKEAPFLLLAAAAQLPSLDVDASLRIGRTLGYSPARCWSRLVLPRLYPRIRLTLFVILAFNLSVVDMALILGPGNPPTLAVLLLSYVNEPGARAVASAGALLLAVGMALFFIVVIGVERIVAGLAAIRRTSGNRGHGFGFFRQIGQHFVILLCSLSVLTLASLLVWSITQRWRFPSALPDNFTSRHWLGRADLLLSPLWSTILFAAFSCIATLVAAIIWLEAERLGRFKKIDWLWYVPLFIPQITLLFGWQAASLLLSADGLWLTVAYAHWVYTLPYVILIMAVAWRELDPNWSNAAALLGAGYWRVLFRIRLPLLIKPVLQAMAVAVAVSVAQYLPTALLGAGRHNTLAIEVVTSFGGVDRRIIATLAVLQSLLPLLVFSMALAVPAVLQRRRSIA
jgi:putative thiamine transport system permease protein